MSKPAPYLLDVGASEAARLALINRIYGPYTESFLSRAGLAPGMTVLDVGCGTGTVTSWIASRGGHVLGVDASEEQLAVAGQAATAAGLDNVEFRALSASDLDKLDRRFDPVFAQSVDLAYRAARSRGTDLDYGKAVFGQFLKLGCVDIELQVVQPALTSPATKRLWPMFFRSARPSLLQSGLIGEAELDAIVVELD